MPARAQDADRRGKFSNVVIFGASELQLRRAFSFTDP